MPEKIYLMYCDSGIKGEVLELDQYDLPLKPEVRGNGEEDRKKIEEKIENNNFEELESRMEFTHFEFDHWDESKH